MRVGGGILTTSEALHPTPIQVLAIEKIPEGSGLNFGETPHTKKKQHEVRFQGKKIFKKTSKKGWGLHLKSIQDSCLSMQAVCQGKAEGQAAPNIGPPMWNGKVHKKCI